MGDRGRANHPPVMTRATGITHPGFYGRKPWKKPNSTLIIDGPRPAKEGLRLPFRKLPPNRSLKLPAHPSHARPGYRHRSPRLTLFRSSRFSDRSPRVEERSPSPVGDLPVAVEPPQRKRLLRRKRHPVVFEQGQLHHPQEPLLRPPATSRPLPVVGVSVLQPPPLDDERPRIAEHLLVVLGGLQRHQVGVLPPLPGPRRRSSFPCVLKHLLSAWEGPAPA